MVPEHANSWIWTIENFRVLYNRHVSFYSSFNIVCGENRFYFGYNCQGIRHATNQSVIYLRRSEPCTTDVNVMWKISLINDHGIECHSREIPTRFKANDNSEPVTGGILTFDGAITNPVDGYSKNLTIKCDIFPFDDDDTKLSKTDQRFKVLDLKALADYETLLDNPKYSDVVFVVCGKKFKLHKAILSARSPVFAAMFEHSDLKESKQNRVEIIDVDVEVFEQMVRFIYLGNVEMVDRYAAELLAVSDKYQLESLKHVCVRSLLNCITLNSVVQLLTLADMHNIGELKLKCIDFITRHATQVMATEGWKKFIMMIKNGGMEFLIFELYHDIARQYQKYEKTIYTE